MNTYVILIPNSSGAYARYNFETDNWQSTNDLSETWTVDAPSANEAVENFRQTFRIGRFDWIGAEKLK